MSLAMRRFAGLGLFASLASFGQADDMGDMIAQMDRKIDESLAAYNEFLSETSEEKLELISQINDLESETIAQRERERQLIAEAARAEIELEDLQDRISGMDALADYTKGLLSDYLTNFESRINLAEDQRYRDTLRDARERLSESSLNVPDAIETYLDMVELGISRQEALVGGDLFSGRAITGAGGVKSGQIALLGPVAYFSGDDGQTAGLLRFNSGTIEPGLNEFDPPTAAGIRNFVAQGQGALPLDASLGNAISLETAKGTLVQHVQKGGWVGYAILLLGAAAIAISLVKLSDLRRSRVATPDDLCELARVAEDDPDAALRATANLPPATQEALRVAIENRHMPEDFQMDSIDAVALKHRQRFERFLPFLATTAAAAPLLGLLGTVVGMIKTFTLITVFGTGDAKSLSSGISEALVTTELGLIVAIPALILHGAFVRMCRHRIATVERVGSEFVAATASSRAKELA